MLKKKDFKRVKYLKYTCLCFLILLVSNIEAQPNICLNPPTGYQKGGDFDITVERGGQITADNYLCLPEKVAVGRIGVIDKSSFSNSSIKYIFGVDNATSIPSSIPLITSRNVDGQSAGEFWIMQIGEENGQKKLNCKKLQIDVSERPLLELSNCNQETFTLNITANNPVSYYSINWNDGLTPEKAIYQNTEVKVPHSYQQPVPEFIEVTGVYENTALNRTCNSVVVQIATPSPFHIKSIETQDFGNQLIAILGVQNPESINLDICISEDNGIVYTKKISSKSGFFLIGGLPKKELCFKAKYSHSSRCYLESPPVCIINPKANNSNYGQIDLEWNSIDGNATYEVIRTGGTPMKASNLSETSYTDNKLDCNGNYLYKIIGTYKDINGNDTEVISHYVKSNANFSPNLLPKQALVATIMSDGRPQLNILDSTGSVQYIIYRSIDNQPFSKIDETRNNQFIDVGNANLNQYCYYVNYIDVCNNISPSSPIACTILLGNNVNELNWNSPTDSPQSSVIYEIVSLNPTQLLSVQTENTFTITNAQNQREQYQVIATITYDIDGKIYEATSVSNPWYVDFTNQVYFPNAFTPNGDGLNDVFEVMGDPTLINEFKMFIYNKWGKLIFESNDMFLGWSGITDGYLNEIGIYTVKLEYKDVFGLERTKIGQVSLIR